MSKINVDTWEPESGTAATLMASGDTVTVPSGAELDIASGATLDVNGTIDVTGATVTGLTTGTVLQVLEDNLNTSVSTTSTSYVASGLTITITPASTSSRFLLTLSGGSMDGDTNYLNLDTTFYVGGSEVSDTGPYESWEYYTSGEDPHSAQMVHSPATVSATTYAVFYKTTAGQGWFNLTPARVVFTVMELSS